MRDESRWSDSRALDLNYDSVSPGALVPLLMRNLDFHEFKEIFNAHLNNILGSLTYSYAVLFLPASVTLVSLRSTDLYCVQGCQNHPSLCPNSPAPPPQMSLLWFILEPTHAHTQAVVLVKEEGAQW